MQKVSLIARTSAVISLVVIFAIGLVTFLNYLKFERTLTTLLQSRLELMIRDLRADIEWSLNLGLALNELRNFQPLVERLTESDRHLLAVDVFGTDGLSVFHSDRQQVGQPAPPGYGTILRQDEARLWWSREDDALIAGTVLINNLGQVTGGATLRYSSAGIDATLERTATYLTGTLPMLMAGVVLVVIGLVVPSMWRTASAFVGITRGLERFVAADPTDPVDPALRSVEAGEALKPLEQVATDLAAAEALLPRPSA